MANSLAPEEQHDIKGQRARPPGRPRRARADASRSKALGSRERPNPRYDTFEIDLDHCGPMVLDALIKIKNEVDPTLTFRRSAAGHLRVVLDEHERPQRPRLHHGDGRPAGDIRITPLPHMEVVKDLVPDFTNFYAAIRLDPAVAADRHDHPER